MTSQRRILANRRNARKSTGPTSEEGRKTSSQNAIRHGFFCREALISGENPADLERLIRVFRQGLHPVGALEEQYVDEIASLTWRLSRATRVEAGLFSSELSHLSAQYSLTGIKEMFDQVMAGSDVNQGELQVPGLSPVKASSDSDRVAFAFLEGARRSDVFSKLSRYEVMLDRRRTRKLNELARLQAARRGEPVTLPMSLDVTVEGDGE